MIAVLIPCFNEEKNILKLINDIKKFNKNLHIFIINDASTDNTLLTAMKIPNINVVDIPINLGVGAAMQLAFQIIAKQNFNYAVKLDGDRQHDPKFIKNMLKNLKENNADIIIGSRYLKTTPYKTPIIRRIGQTILALTAKMLTSINFTDPTSGFRAYNKNAIKFMAKNYPTFGYPEPEELILASKNNLKVLEMPVIMRPRADGKSSITSIGSIFYMLKVLLSMFFIFIRKPV